MNSSAKMDKFIRLSSMQSGAFNGINNMITFNLPQDGAYDFSSSYVEINTQIDQASQDSTNAGAEEGSAIYNPQLKWYDTNACVNNSMFIRRGQLRSSKQGLIEDVLRQDILQSNIVNYTHSTEEMSSLSYKNAVQHRNRFGTRSSMWREFSQPVQDSDTTEFSRVLNAPINIPLSQIINLGSASVVPLDRMGGGQLMIDGNFSQGATGWAVESDITTTAASKEGENVAAEVRTNQDWGTGDFPITMSGVYTDMTACPFWVGANVVVAATGGSATLLAGAANCVITKMALSSTGVLDLTMDQSCSTVGDTETVEDITVSLKAPDEEGELRFVSAQLVLKKLAYNPPAAPSLTYTTFETEEFSQATSTQCNATFRLPANCINAIIMLPQASGDGISRLTQLETYRLSIDNVPIINRAIDVTGGIRNALHYDLIMRSFEAGQLPLRNMSEIIRDTGGTIVQQLRGQNTGGREDDMIIIGVPTVETPQSKLLQINLTASSGLVNVIVFKQVVRTIQL